MKAERFSSAFLPRFRFPAAFAGIAVRAMARAQRNEGKAYRHDFGAREPRLFGCSKAWRWIDSAAAADLF